MFQTKSGSVHAAVSCRYVGEPAGHPYLSGLFLFCGWWFSLCIILCLAFRCWFGWCFCAIETSENKSNVFWTNVLVAAESWGGEVGFLRATTLRVSFVLQFVSFDKCCSQAETDTDRWTGRQTERQTDRWTDIDRQTHRQTEDFQLSCDSQTDKHRWNPNQRTDDSTHVLEGAEVHVCNFRCVESTCAMECGDYRWTQCESIAVATSAPDQARIQSNSPEA